LSKVEEVSRREGLATEDRTIIIIFYYLDHPSLTDWPKKEGEAARIFLKSTKLDTLDTSQYN